jgi:hypothetical protein
MKQIEKTRAAIWAALLLAAQVSGRIGSPRGIARGLPKRVGP